MTSCNAGPVTSKIQENAELRAEKNLVIFSHFTGAETEAQGEEVSVLQSYRESAEEPSVDLKSLQTHLWRRMAKDDFSSEAGRYGVQKSIWSFLQDTNAFH